MATITLETVEEFLAAGWSNVEVLDLSRFVSGGQVITIILSDATYPVPATMPNGANMLAYKQHQFDDKSLVKIRALTRG